MMKRLKDERGMAMIIALLVSFVVLLLSTVVVTQSIHSSRGSGYDRERLQSVNAAEAGNNYFYATLQNTPPASVSCSAVTQTINSAPATASFTATPTFYNSAGAVIYCPFSETTYPAYVLINSVGKAANEAPRTFQTYMRLSLIHGGFTGAIISNAGMTFGNNFNTYGNSGSNADVYVINGDYSQSNNSVVRGNVYVSAGSATMSNSSQIQGNLYTLNSAGLTTVTGDVTSTTSTISGGTVGGNATAGGAITSTVTGTKLQNQTGLANPPTQTFPQITYVASDWTSAGYTEHVYTGASACTNARAFVEGTIPAGNHVVRITGATPCTYTNTVNSTVTMNGNLAIISDWSIDISLLSDWNGVTSTRNLYFIVTWAEDLVCSTANKTLSTGNNTNFNSLTQTLFYTPCTASMSNSNSFSGQVVGNPVIINNQFSMTYQPVYVPGVNGATGFQQDISYVREVV